jgi:hypothetical protein
LQRRELLEQEASDFARRPAARTTKIYYCSAAAWPDAPGLCESPLPFSLLFSQSDFPAKFLVLADWNN